MKYAGTNLQKVLDEHEKWLNGDGGSRADFRGACLDGANLDGAMLDHALFDGASLEGALMRGASLYSAHMMYANLMGADMTGAYMRLAVLAMASLDDAIMTGVNLEEASLTGAMMTGTHLDNATLTYANLKAAYITVSIMDGAVLDYASLEHASLCCTRLDGASLKDSTITGTSFYGVDLDKAINVPFIPMVCPDSGSFVGWKKCEDSLIVKLLIPDDAKRSSGASRKCRCDKATVLAIENIDGTQADVGTAVSQHDSNFIYRVGETVSVDDFDGIRWHECSTGIHFFVNRQEAVEYQ